jgi:phosphoglycerol geranylgeranyltransferase
LEAGSGAPDPVPVEMIKAVKHRVGLPLIVGGGIRDAAAARTVVEAGADIFVTGNLLEADVDVHKTLGEILRNSVDQLRRRFRQVR